MSASTYDLIILGGGPAGYSAAIYGARSGLSCAVIEQGMPGGQIATTDEVENYPAIPHTTGPELGTLFQEHADELGAETLYMMAGSVQKTDFGFSVSDESGNAVSGKALIAATGAVPREVGFEGERAYRGRGISYCATCDGMFYRGKTVYVVGGGNAACEEGLYLSNLASEVIMVVRRDEFRAPAAVAERLVSAPNVSVRFDTSIVRVEGDALISRIVFRNNRTGEETVDEFDPGSRGVFVFAGTKPVTELYEHLVDLNPDGGVLTDDEMATRTPGLFAAGDVRSKKLRQVITAASDGAIAATAAYRYIKSINS